MNYPLISEYIEAIKSAEDIFEELSFLKPVLGNDGLPVMTSGNFAVVFKMKDKLSGKLYAVKCFTKEQEGRSEAYKLIADELKAISSNYLSSIEYYEKELFVDSSQTDETEFPILLMDWVEGKPLDVFIKENLEKRYVLHILSVNFNKLASWLLTQPFAHGDLKLDNILVREDGTLVLVDYDGMYVPAMKGQKAREIGSPGFRHPSRDVNYFNEHIDDFAIASIALSLKAIAIKPSLYEDLGGNDRLLFSETDYMDRCESNCISILQPLLKDDNLCTLFGIFMIAWAKNDISSVSYKILSSDDSLNSDVIYAVAQYKNAMYFIYHTKEYEKAYDAFEFLAKYGNVRSEEVENRGYVCGRALGENGLGYMYANGLYVEQDFEKAASWFRKSSKRNFAVALHNMGVCFAKGKGVAKNPEVATKYYRKSSSYGFLEPFADMKYGGWVRVESFWL
jgi:serine/threonine protein kinase